MSAVLRALVRGYQLILSPYLPASCRFMPTCSDYMLQAIEKHGAWRGLRAGLRRIGRCHPFGGFGYDPID